MFDMESPNSHLPYIYCFDLKSKCTNVCEWIYTVGTIAVTSDLGFALTTVLKKSCLNVFLKSRFVKPCVHSAIHFSLCAIASIANGLKNPKHPTLSMLLKSKHRLTVVCERITNYKVGN